MIDEIQDDNPIEVHGGVVDLSKAPDEQTATLIPPIPNVNLRIKSIKARESKDQTLKKLNIMFQLVDGIDEEGKLRNATFWSNGNFFDQFWFYADTNVKTSPFYAEGKHLSRLKSLAKATGIELTMGIDEMITELNGKELVGTVTQKSKTTRDEDGNDVETGELENVVTNIKASS